MLYHYRLIAVIGNTGFFPREFVKIVTEEEEHAILEHADQLADDVAVALDTLDQATQQTIENVNPLSAADDDEPHVDVQDNIAAANDAAAISETEAPEQQTVDPSTTEFDDAAADEVDPIITAAEVVIENEASDDLDNDIDIAEPEASTNTEQSEAVPIATEDAHIDHATESEDADASYDAYDDDSDDDGFDLPTEEIAAESTAQSSTWAAFSDNKTEVIVAPEASLYLTMNRIKPSLNLTH